MRLAIARRLSTRSALPAPEPLSRAGRYALSLGAALLALRDPRRADLVATVGETAPGTVPALRHLRDRMLASPEGRDVLRERPRLTARSTAHLAALPAHTFGAHYARFLATHRFSPDDRPVARFVADAELAYVAQRYRECHDLWHVLNDMPTSLLGEVTQKYFEAVHTRLPMAAAAAAAGPFRLRTAAQRNHFANDLAPWAGRRARRCADLMCVYYERHWNDDMSEFRQRLRLEGPPPSPPPPSAAA